MRFLTFLALLGVWLTACGAPVTPPATVEPTFAPMPLAQTTNAPTPTLDPRATATSLPTSAVQRLASTQTTAPTITPTTPATATSVPPTSKPVATETPALTSPTILDHLNLNELPGQGRAPGALAAVSDTLYIANRLTSNLAVVKDAAVQSYIDLPAAPSALAADAASGRIYVGSYETPTLLLLQNDRIVRQATAGGRVNALALQDGILYAALDNDAIIERFDANTLTKRDELKLSQGFGVSDLVIDAPRNRLYAAEYGRIVAIDLDTFKELHSMDAPSLYGKLAVNPADGSIWAGAYDSDSSRAYLIGYKPDGQELARLFVGSDLSAAAFDNDGRLYVLDRYANNVYVVETPSARLVATIPVNESPSDAIFDAARKLVLVTNQDSNNLSLINTTSARVTDTVPLANDITALASNPKRKRVYAVNGSANTVYIVEGTHIVGQVRTGNAPVDIALDPDANRIYVASRADGMVTMIDEDSLQIVASQFITHFLSTVAMDSENEKLFAGGNLLNPTTLGVEQTFAARGITLDSQTTPQYERPNPALQKLYALASNAVPGSNSRVTLYRFLYSDLTQSKLLGSSNSGNTTAIAIDPTNNHLFAASTHPLGYTSVLDEFDADDTLVRSLALTARTAAMVVNPVTGHLFLAHDHTNQPDPSGAPAPDNTVEILDTTTLGRVASLDVPNEPAQLTLLDDRVYVASALDGSITIIGDAKTAPPAAPTPTLTPSPYPTWTPTPVSAPTATATPIPTQAAQAKLAPCPIAVAADLQAKADQIGREALGCPTADVVTSNQIALQEFQTGLMLDDFRDENAKQIFVLLPNGVLQTFPDMWHDGQPDDQCPDVQVGEHTIRPVRGFGSVWCNEDDVRALGGGIGDERIIEVTLQPFERGVLWSIPERGVIGLLNNSTWQ